MAWPTDDLTTTHYDAGTDDPSQARSELIDLKTKVSELIAGRATANGVCDLDGSSLVPTTRLPTIPTAKLPSSHTKNAANGIPGLDASSNLLLKGFDITYDEARAALGGDFDAGQEVVFVRIGNIVIISAQTNLSHSSSSNPTSAASVIPSGLRPSTGNVHQIYFNSGTAIFKVQALSSGSIEFLYSDYTGSPTSTTGTQRGFGLSYVIEGNIA